MLSSTRSTRSIVACLEDSLFSPIHERAQIHSGLTFDKHVTILFSCKGNAGDVLLLHPHLAHSSTTNVRFGRDVRLALTKRAYWTTGMEMNLAYLGIM